MTNKDIENLEEGKTLYDRGSPLSVPGLHVRAFKTKKVFYCFVSVRGRSTRPKIGDTRIFTIEQARKIAKQLRAGAVIGVDLISIADEKADEKTVQEVFDAAWAEHWNIEKYLKSRHALEVKRLYEKNIKPEFGKMKLSEVSASRIRLWLADFVMTPYTGNRSLEVLSTLFTFAERQEWRAQNTNPCKIVKAFSEKKRDRYARPEEIRRIGELLHRYRERCPREVAFIYLLMFTGARPSAIERATWDDYDRARGTITVDGKTGRDTITIPRQAAAVLELLPRDTATITGIKMPRSFWANVREEAGCPDLWARDWRRTFATILMGEGKAMPVISELLNHKSMQTTKVYAKLDGEKRRELAETAGGKIEELIGGGA